MRPRARFAPISSGPSAWLNVAAGYFMLSGVIYGVIVIAAIVFLLRGSDSLPPATLATGAAINLVAAVGYFWIGVELASQRKRGGYFALAVILLPLFSLPFAGTIDWSTVFWTVFSLVVLALIWRDLS